MHLRKFLTPAVGIKFTFEKKVFKNSKAMYSIDSMGTLSKLGALFLLLIIVIAFLYFFERQTFCSIFSSVMNPNISSKICGTTIPPGQKAFVSNEIKAIESSSPIPIKQVAVFGSNANITKNITYQQQALFYDNLSVYEIEYNGIYFPVSITIGDLLKNSTFTNTSLVGQKVYLSFITNNYKNASALYTINKIYTKGNMFYWILGQDTGISNKSEILDNTSYSIAEFSASQLNGVVFLNNTAFISPTNPLIINKLHNLTS